MHLKVYQTPKQSTAVCNTHGQDFTTLESHHSKNCFIFHYDDQEVNSTNSTVIVQNNLPGMCTWICLFGKNGFWLDDATLRRSKVEPS